MNIKTQRMLSLSLSLINAAGVIGTFIFVSKEAPKAKEELSKLPKDAKKSTKIKTFIKNYKKSLVVAGATIASGISSRLISAKTEASLMATVYMLDASLRKYKCKVKETLGIDADKSIIKEIMKDNYDEKMKNKAQDGEELYYEEHIGYFYAKPEKIHMTMLLMNEDLSGNNNWYVTGRDSTGVFTIGEFLESCEGRALSHNLDNSKLNFGWSFDYLLDFYECSWVHADISEPDENGAKMIYWFEDPIWNPGDWYRYYFEDMTKDEYLQEYKGDIKELNKQYYITGKEKNTK